MQASPGETMVPILGQVETDAVERRRRFKPLTLFPLVALVFYDVSGGPFGIEEAVSDGGPLLAILGFLILPLVWSVPEAMITAELATAFPENSGYVAWVTAAFGPFWGFQEGFFSWLSGVTDNSVYPVMFLTYLDAILPGLDDPVKRYTSLAVASLLLAYLNYRGLSIVGWAAVAMTIFIIVPFIVLVGIAAPHVEPKHWVAQDWKGVQWGPFLNVMFWNLNYWDSVSTLAGEVPKPHRTVPRALGMAVLLVVVTYVVPLLAGIGITTSVQDWQLGYFAHIAQMVGGKWLGWWVVAAAAVSQIGQFEAEMSSDAFQLLGMAERGFLPAALAKRSKHDTPTLAICCSSIGILMLVTFNFSQIVELLNVIYCIAELMEFAAFIWLRIAAPELHRPYRVPLPTWACALMLLPASALLLTLIGMPILQLDWLVIGWTLGAMIVGGCLYPLLQRARKDQWCRFMGTSPHDFSDALKGLFIPYSLVNSLTPSRTTSGELPAHLGLAGENGVQSAHGSPSAGQPSSA
ncbi:hypothetical protein WJX73_010869 [Symbiochloris irregularis]|uniref:Polyamine transporter n=1 Tax=Symbiochloris irregularis TaxID=706552 RepID=A0AAW1P032_9CHLO